MASLASVDLAAESRQERVFMTTLNVGHVGKPGWRLIELAKGPKVAACRNYGALDTNTAGRRGCTLWRVRRKAGFRTPPEEFGSFRCTTLSLRLEHPATAVAVRRFAPRHHFIGHRSIQPAAARLPEKLFCYVP